MLQIKYYSDWSIGFIEIFLLETEDDGRTTQVCYDLSSSHNSHILRTARRFWKYCKKKGWGGCLALESHVICSSKQSCMKTKVDIVCFILNSVFLIDQKKRKKKRRRLRRGKRCARTSFFLRFDPYFCLLFCSFFSFFSSSFLLLFPMHLFRLAI